MNTPVSQGKVEMILGKRDLTRGGDPTIGSERAQNNQQTVVEAARSTDQNNNEVQEDLKTEDKTHHHADDCL